MNKNIRKIIKGILPEKFFSPLREAWRETIKLQYVGKNQQNLFLERYKKLSRIKSQKEIFLKNEFKIFSQNGEDGIIAHIFSLIGTKNNIFAEIGIEDGRESNTANLSINFGWEGILIDGDKNCVIKAKEYYENLGLKDKVKIIPCFVTKENINEVFMKNGLNGEIDFLSIDIDGNDYWIWDAIKIIKPRVISIEYNPIFGKTESFSTKYDSNFMRFKKHPSGQYQGASLSALKKLGNSKGYSLVCCDSSGCNAFFVLKKEIKKLKELSASEAYYPSSRVLKRYRNEKSYEKINFLEFKKIRHLEYENI